MPYWVYVMFIVGVGALIVVDEKKQGYVLLYTLGLAGFLGICAGLAILGYVLGLQ